MSLDEKRRAYQAFFLTNEYGKEFMIELDNIISRQHTAAEDKPEQSRDFVQRAKGVRDVLSHINAMTADRNKPKG